MWTEEIQALKSCEEFLLKQTNLQSKYKIHNYLTLKIILFLSKLIIAEDTFSPSYYDIRNAKGKLKFKAIESVDPNIRDLYHDKHNKPPFVITIFDMKAGKEMLRINANLRQGVVSI